MPLRLATILAHPDDETFGTGGTLIRYAREGIEVHSLCLTEGEKGWAGIDDHIVPRELVGPTRAKEPAEAGRRRRGADRSALIAHARVRGVHGDARREAAALDARPARRGH